MSIKPKFGWAILRGEKRYELRRLVGRLIEPGDVVYLYFTKPVGVVHGLFEAGVVFLTPVKNLATLLAELGDVGVGEEDLKYVEGARYAMLIEVKNPRQCNKPVPPAEAGLRPPPSYMRIGKREAEALAELCEGARPEGLKF